MAACSARCMSSSATTRHAAVLSVAAFRTEPTPAMLGAGASDMTGLGKGGQSLGKSRDSYIKAIELLISAS